MGHLPHNSRWLARRSDARLAKCLATLDPRLEETYPENKRLRIVIEDEMARRSDNHA